jgi:hypothetical protein
MGKRPDLSLGESHRMSIEHRCPNCREGMDAATGIGVDDAPKPGDVGICMLCSGIFVYGPALVPRKPTLQEIASMKADRQQWGVIESARRAAAEVRDEFRKTGKGW